MAGSAAFARLRFARFELQLDERRLLADGQPAPVRGHAFDLLAALAERPGHLITKTELLQRVWGKVVVEENALQAHISALRKVLGAAAIATVPGQGYRFALDVHPVPPPAEAVPAPAHNLPQPLTSFIGREREIEAIQQRLASSRLLTLTGAGGIGKTRLALQVARGALGQYPGGVWLAELAPLSDPTLLVQAVARALAVEAKAGQPIEEALLDWLRPRHTLLVMDNVEHLLDACARLVERLLTQCEGLTVLATSRERLGIDGEATHRVPSLSLPAGGVDEDLLDCEAARLLIDRARLQRPDFEVKGDEVGTLASVCRRLDGIALAIELAAAQLRMMSLDALSRRLDDRFRLLGGGARTALPRHQTLRALIDWSHELLSDAEKTLLRRVSVFAGGWTQESAERVCAGDGVDGDQVWSLLSSLSDKSLLVTDTAGGQTRFDLLETIRHYAHDRLVESGEREVVQERHLGHLVEMAVGLESTNGDAEVQQAIDRLETEHDNLRAALAWCETDPTRTRDGLRLAAQLCWFWWLRHHAAEGRAWLDRFFAKTSPVERDEAYAAALHTSGALAISDRGAAAGAARLEEAIALWRDLDNPRQLVRSIGTLANFLEETGDLTGARANLVEALSIARAIGDDRSIALALFNQSWLEQKAGELATAEALLIEGLPFARKVGWWMEGNIYKALSSVRRVQGDLVAARDTLLKAIEKLNEFGDLDATTHSRLLLAEILQDMGDLSGARTHLQTALVYQPQGIHAQLILLNTCAGLLSELGGPLRAAELWGCVQRHDEAGRSVADTSTRSRQRRLQEAARRVHGDDAAFDRALEVGRSWTVDAAFASARGLL